MNDIDMRPSPLVRRGQPPSPYAHVAMVLGVTLVVALLCGVSHSHVRAQSVGGPASKPVTRLDRLEAWLAAVQRHEPGSTDGPVMTVRSWNRGELRQVWIDFSSVVSLVRDPGVGIFFVEPERLQTQRTPTGRQRPVQVSYSRNEVQRLRNLARVIGDENHLLKRGAMLHADIAMLAPPAGGPIDSFSSGPGGINLYMSDGRQAGLEGAISHWDMGRRLLDRVRPDGARDMTPDPSRDETVRLWYLATGAFMQSLAQLDPWHFERAVQLFPKDAKTLFLAGCLHEAESGPRVQVALRSVSVPRDVTFDVGSEASELREAERLFRRALEVDPRSVEARVRLGRTLGRLGRHADAASELGRAISNTRNTLLLYYGTLFLGAEEDALGNREEARRSYERAASLYPRAQSPRLALSRLEAQAGNRAAALDAIQATLRLQDVGDADDPWWSYYIAQARGVDALVEELRKVFRTGNSQ